MNLIKFAKDVGNLKKVRRTGWLVAGIRNPESVAEHSLRLAILSMIVARKFKLNTEKLIKMALLHDLAESTTGDIVHERRDQKIMDKKKRPTLKEKQLKKSLKT